MLNTTQALEVLVMGFFFLCIGDIRVMASMFDAFMLGVNGKTKNEVLGYCRLFMNLCFWWGFKTF